LHHRVASASAERVSAERRAGPLHPARSRYNLLALFTPWNRRAENVVDLCHSEVPAVSVAAGWDGVEPSAAPGAMSGAAGAAAPAPATLGDVLYADKSRAVAPEREWVELVRRIAAGDQLALHALYDRTHRVVFTLVMRITRSRESAEELTLDVFLEIWRRAARYDAANGTVLGWVMNLARSRAIDRLRFDNRVKRVDPRAGDAASDEESGEACDVIELKQQAAALRAALGVLSPDERIAIETAFFDDLTYAEVAARLNQPLGTIKTRIRSGLHKLRRALSEKETPR
jgi:RNA polymerase sigma-70 factor (ECF subfamily)